MGASPLDRDAVPWFRGALGELHVAGELGELGPKWTVLHAVPVGANDADIDHVLIGPAGVFSLNTKNHSGQKVWVAGGTFLVNGQRTAYIERSRAESRDAGARLSRHLGTLVNVSPLLVVVDPASLTRGRKPTEVAVVTSRELVPWLEAQADSMTRDEQRKVVAIAEKRSTWHALAVSPDDTQPHVRRFERLRVEVAQASRRRRMVTLGAGVALIAVALSGILWLPPIITAVAYR